MKIEWNQQCNSCKGTGIYVGMCEQDGYGAVCRTCHGTGKTHHSVEYEEFTGLKKREDIHTVLEVSGTIVAGIGKDKNGNALEFGGMPYKFWYEGVPFPIGSEMRNYYCPLWWKQSTGKYKEFDCDEMFFGAFKDCKHFKNKEECWKKFDRMYRGR